MRACRRPSGRRGVSGQGSRHWHSRGRDQKPARDLSTARPILDQPLKTTAKVQPKRPWHGAILPRQKDNHKTFFNETINPKPDQNALKCSPWRVWLPAQHELLDRSVLDFDDFHDMPFVMLAIDELADTSTCFWLDGIFRRNFPAMATPSLKGTPVRCRSPPPLLPRSCVTG